MAKKPAPRAPARGRGRPRIEFTLEQRQQVEQLVSVGTTEEDIATFLRIAIMTLRTNFSEELRFGRMKRRAEVVDLLFTSARAGNVSAQKKLEDMTGIAMSARPAPEMPDKPVKLGKKEEALLAARNPDATTPMGELMARRSADASGKVH